MIEQRKLSEGQAICLLDTQGVICVSGVDRLSWLHSLLSQNLKNLNVGESAEALLLDPQGHIEQVVKVIDDGETSWLIVDKSQTENLLAWLTKMVFRMKVEITDRSKEFASVGSVQPMPEISFVSNTHPLIWKDQWPGVVAGGHRYSERVVKHSWFEHLVLVDGIEKTLNGKVLAGTMAADGLRVAAGRPKALNEVDDKSLPHELDLLATAVHLSKGCYRGQESVAKVHNLGHPPRRLTFLHLDGSEHA